ncbi:MAG: hypothetical protein WDZ80_04285, partial [Candidatus Paceibacterota bacterium]
DYYPGFGYIFDQPLMRQTVIGLSSIQLSNRILKMRNYRVRFVQGYSSTKNGSTNFMGTRGTKNINAKNKVEAFLKFRNQFEDEEITLLIDYSGSGTPLGFSKEEIKEIENSNISLKTGVPKSGIQIEEIILEENSEL